MDRTVVHIILSSPILKETDEYRSRVYLALIYIKKRYRHVIPPHAFPETIGRQSDGGLAWKTNAFVRPESIIDIVLILTPIQDLKV